MARPAANARYRVLARSVRVNTRPAQQTIVTDRRIAGGHPLSPLTVQVAAAQNAPGVTDAEIKFGNIMPYSGPASMLSATGKTAAAYFEQLNAKGGVNGRKLTMISLDDAFSPPKTVEATRRLVESENVAFMFGTMGTAPTSATAKYLNGKGAPHLFFVSSASKWNDPKNMPWLMARPWAPMYPDEAAIGINFARSKKPDDRFAILYLKDDSGKDCMIEYLSLIHI